jgi:hypothetical protein
MPDLFVHVRTQKVRFIQDAAGRDGKTANEAVYRAMASRLGLAKHFVLGVMSRLQHSQCLDGVVEGS